jgi:hypothetical protein
MEDEKARVEERIQRLIEQARTTGKPIKVRSSARYRSSLGQIIKTKEQADALMAALKTL